MMIQRNLKAQRSNTVEKHTHAGDVFLAEIWFSSGQDARSKSGFCLYADKAAAVGAEMIAIHACGLFSSHSLDNRETGA